MTRMIERWFPSAEVSANSRSGWGSGNTEVGLMTWFAKRPTAQAKAAVICSLLPWPDEPAEQLRLQELVRAAMTDRFACASDVRAEIERHRGSSSTAMLDPFSGRGMIPLEAARLGLPAFALDYSRVAVLASRLLADYALRNWDDEPPLPFADESDSLIDGRPRLFKDATAFIRESAPDTSRRWTPSIRRWRAVDPGVICGRSRSLQGVRTEVPAHRSPRLAQGEYQEDPKWLAACRRRSVVLHRIRPRPQVSGASWCKKVRRRDANPTDSVGKEPLRQWRQVGCVPFLRLRP